MKIVKNAIVSAKQPLFSPMSEKLLEQMINDDSKKER